MADLGALVTRPSPLALAQRTGVWWATQAGVPGGTIAYTKASRALWVPQELGAAVELINTSRGVLSGTVLDGAAPVSGAVVCVFVRASLMPLARTTTDSNGEFTFSGIPNFPAAYFVCAFDPDGDPAYNALIFDRLTPV